MTSQNFSASFHFHLAFKAKYATFRCRALTLTLLALRIRFFLGFSHSNVQACSSMFKHQRQHLCKQSSTNSWGVWLATLLGLHWVWVAPGHGVDVLTSRPTFSQNGKEESCKTQTMQIMHGHATIIATMLAHEF